MTSRRPAGRPRRHNRDDLLDHIRKLWVQQGTSGVTIRALSEASGASNGALYNAFGSRDGLLAAAWTREASRFLDFQRESVENTRTAGGSAADMVVAAALTPAAYAAHDDLGARLLLAVTLDDLATGELTEPQRRELGGLRHTLSELISLLAQAQWDRPDADAFTLIKYCIVDLPGALLLKAHKVTDPLAVHALEHAVRGIVSAPPPRPTS
ncbi:TetR/AcrR family transcriptional regulator [Rhodococcus chondri]|uniref:TetR/AcrR family transcriptional regulator n=1 Tax=Rhodococcus chondri TaxID=3065941 RepID=A0ABU7JR93_9NOCA|nr:TetR/AcrR family transcriptional regulator [Rhodococcus sp. CC-R104]MEE2032539.1 TetR/AcrR family transcriptional regulator [Rhodococcus sp. CC-R104]